MRLAAVVLAAMMPVAAQSSECFARSGPHAAVLVELYTSEGCDSCPPADRWLSGLAASGFEASRVVPIALHVDYWDYIGWKDPFANAAYSERQRQGVRISGGRIVYTPQVTFNGKDFGAWRSASGFRDAVASAAGKPAKASVELEARASGAQVEIGVRASLQGATGLAEHAVYVALTESRLESAVKAGENKGATLRHDHVVRVLKRVGRVTAASGFEGNARLDLARDWKAGDLAIVAFVQNPATGEVAQALRLPLCKA